VWSNGKQRVKTAAQKSWAICTMHSGTTVQLGRASQMRKFTAGRGFDACHCADTGPYACVCCAGTCRYPGAEVQFVGYQYSGASGPLPGIPYSTLADDDGNVRARSRCLRQAVAAALADLTFVACTVGNPCSTRRWKRPSKDRPLHSDAFATTVWPESQRVRLLDW
jgi:hypothetical protein